MRPTPNEVERQLRALERREFFGWFIPSAAIVIPVTGTFIYLFAYYPHYFQLACAAGTAIGIPLSMWIGKGGNGKN